MKPRLYIHVGRAGHFLKWEIPEFKKYFELVDAPSDNAILLSFGPDVLEQAASLPALKRFAVLFPGFGKNPVHNVTLREQQKTTINSYYDAVFINPGPLQIAYKGLDNIIQYPFSVDVDAVRCRSYREQLDSLIHVSNDGPQKDWRRSEAIMKETGLRYEVFPPRDNKYLDGQIRINNLKNTLRRSIGVTPKQYLPHGYVNHGIVIKKYQQYDGFVHIANEIVHDKVLDGKYTASLIEAGLTGAILFWHDTFGLGNELESVFNLPKDITSAAEMIMDIRSSININKHSILTRQELLDTYNPQKSVAIRSTAMLSMM